MAAFGAAVAVEAVVVPVGLDELPALLISEAVIVPLDKALPNNPARALIQLPALF